MTQQKKENSENTALQVFDKSDDPKSIIDRARLEKLLEQKERIAMQKFQTILHTDPMSVNKVFNSIRMRDNVPYIPISTVEMLLDELFFGQWKTTGFTGRQVANEVVGEIELHYKHPVSGEWLSRSGAAAKQIQQKSKTPILEFAQHKYPNALEKVWPAMKSEAVKNAAKQIGKLFGRDLGRKDEDEAQFDPFYSQEKEQKIKKSLDEVLGRNQEDGQDEKSPQEEAQDG